MKVLASKIKFLGLGGMIMSYIFNIKNCNNIKNANIIIDKNNLNIKYGMNGTGKSTISKAIELFSLGEEIDPVLRTFGSSENATIECNEIINSVMIFDEEFVKNIVFEGDSVIRDSFDVFVKSPDYDRRINKLNNRLKGLKTYFLEDEEVQKLKRIMSEVAGKLILTKNDEVTKNPFYKSVVTDKNLFNIPEKLKRFSPFIIENPSNVDWIDWKTKGYKFDEISGCPFCTETLVEDYISEKELFQNTFKKATANNLKQMLKFFESLKEYITDEKYVHLVSCIKEIEDVETIDLALNKFGRELHYLLNKFNSIENFDSFSIKQSDISKLDEIIKSMFINIESTDVFKSDKMVELVDSINSKLDIIKNEVQELKGEVGQIRGYVQAAIRKYNDDINKFLLSAGMRYKVEITVNGDKDAITKLYYIGDQESTNEVEKISKHLSWGEKNAFALVLFMFYAISRKPDIIILDDPISSFDSNKKYAIINRLFANNENIESFYRKTLLMLTHDFEPIIDFVVNKKPTGGYITANFIRNNNGQIIEKVIIKDNGFQSYIKMLTKYVRREEINYISRLVFLRQLIEHIGDSEQEMLAYNLISSLVHGNANPTVKNDSGEERDATPQEVNSGNEYIKTYIEDFNYDKFSTEYFTKHYLEETFSELSNNYLKLQIFRTYTSILDCRDSIKNDVLLKFIDQMYHIENDYIYYLDLLEYDIVPEHIANECNKFFESLLVEGATV